MNGKHPDVVVLIEAMRDAQRDGEAFCKAKSGVDYDVHTHSYGTYDTATGERTGEPECVCYKAAPVN